VARVRKLADKPEKSNGQVERMRSDVDAAGKTENSRGKRNREEDNRKMVACALPKNSMVTPIPQEKGPSNMRVILAEKPSVAKDIARVLGCNQRADGYFKGPKDIVTYAIGHLVGLPNPEVLNSAWSGTWTKSQLPMIPDKWRYVANDNTAAQFEIIKKLFNDPGTTEIVNAADAGREGEAIFRRIYEFSGSKKPVRRFWASSLTEEAISAAFDSLKPSSQYDALAESAKTRALIDWLWGMNYTRAYTITNQTLCTIGRVQTPTLALICQREAQIKGFVKSFYYQLHAQLPGFAVRALNKEGKFDFETKEEAESIQNVIPPNSWALIKSIDTKPRKTAPPQLYNLGELQKDVNRKFGYTAAQTLEIAQSLYETHKVLTYPRTSSRHLGTDMVSSFAGTLKALEFPAPVEAVAAAIERAEHGTALGKSYVDDSKLSDHHAMIPTRVKPNGLSNTERNVYNLVAKRFLAIFLPDKETKETRVGVELASHKFAANGSRLMAPGWTHVYQGEAELEEATGKKDDSSAEELEQLPPLQIGKQQQVSHVDLKQKERKPPSRFNDATLIAAMETAGKNIEDEELRAIMKGKGLGTEATRAAIIERLEKTEYILRKGKYFEPTAKGVALIAQVSQRIASPSLTAEMEEKLDKIERGTYSSSQLREEIESHLRADIPTVLSTHAIAVAATTMTEDGIICPKCRQGVMRKIKDKPFFGCSGFKNGCHFAINNEIAQKALTQANIKQLCSLKAKTSLIKGFVSNAGKHFDAYVVLNSEYRTQFEFEKKI
jgi:DNA topoisomerase-3